MKCKIITALGAACALVSSVPVMGQFTADEFSAPTLGPQWTFTDGTPAGSTITFPDGNHLRMDGQEGTDFYYDTDTQPYIQQNAPSGTNWEVITKITAYDPTAAGFQRGFLRAGIQLWQDNNHHLSIGVLTTQNGMGIVGQAVWQTDATAPSDDFTHGTNEIPLTSGGDYYLKVIKSTRGYLAQISTDGIAYQNILPLVRNPETADGYFVNEKIRLFHSGGPGFVTGVVKPVDFDYIRTNAIAAPVAGFSNDEFNGASLDPRWQYYEGVRPGTKAIGGGTVKLTTGDFQDLWQPVDRAMYIAQDAPSSNCTLTLKGGPTDLRSFERYNSYGIKLWQDQSNWLFISNQRSDTDPVSNRLEIAFKRNGLYDFGGTDFGAASCPEYLRIEQNNNIYTVSYSYDNVTFTQVTGGQQTYPAKLKNGQVHLFSKKVFGPGDGPFGTGVTAEFDFVRVAFIGSSDASDWQLFN